MRLRYDKQDDPTAYGTIIHDDGRTLPIFMSDDEEGVRVVEAPQSDHTFIIFVSKDTLVKVEESVGLAAFDAALVRAAELLLR